MWCVKLILTFNNTAASNLGGLNYTTTSEHDIFKSSSSQFKRVNHYMIVPTAFPIFRCSYMPNSQGYEAQILLEKLNTPLWLLDSIIMISC